MGVICQRGEKLLLLPCQCRDVYAVLHRLPHYCADQTTACLHNGVKKIAACPDSRNFYSIRATFDRRRARRVDGAKRAWIHEFLNRVFTGFDLGSANGCRHERELERRLVWLQRSPGSSSLDTSRARSQRQIFQCVCVEISRSVAPKRSSRSLAPSLHSS